jgi:hypothetical protein
MSRAGGNGAGATPKGSQETPGALNKGLTTSSALVLLFTFLAYCVPVFGVSRSLILHN